MLSEFLVEIVAEFMKYTSDN